MESGKLALNLKKVSLHEIALRAADTLDSLSKSKKISVKVESQGDCTAMADGDLIERVFINLLGNAIKYTPQNGRITISVEDMGDHFKAGVSDTGEGIPKEYLERVFLKFEQVEGKARGGTGLGLTISRFFVESHLGKIWVESELGKGSSFYFTIPKNLAVNAAGNVLVSTT
jgi:signal transduction histidine kinase